jgi:hypothetical protein
MSKKLLFGGFPYDSGGIYGGLSNQDELVKACPEEFKNENSKWSLYVGKLIESGGKTENWKWQIDDNYERGRMYSFFKTLLKNTGGLPAADCRAVAGWMLSEMLTEVPEYIPCEVKDKDEDEPWIHGERI